jgi:hypothetical protein
MSANLIAITGVIYAYVGIEQLVSGNKLLAIVYAGYAFSNIGLYYLAK